MDKKAFYKLSYGLYIVSSSFEGKDAGCVVNTLNQVTSSPAQMSVAINKDNFTTDIIRKSGKFAGVVLIEDVNMDIIGTFGFKTSGEVNKFENFKTERDESGIPYITEDIAARYSCDVVNEIDLGTHIMFIGKVTEAEVMSENEVMTYAHYQKVKKGATPKNAPSFIEEKPAETGYKCSVCGYHHKSDVLPDDFKCPWCGQGADKFVKI